MYLKTLEITNFRCHSKKKIDFSKGINILLGQNAVGKTSIVEAISYLSIGKSHKTNLDTEIIKFKKDYSIIKGCFSNENINTEVLVSITSEGKRIKRDQKTLKSISEHIGYINQVVFSPEDIAVISKTPSERRRFLDISISQIDKNYMVSLSNYKKLLKQRNELLKNQDVENCVDKVLLSVITTQLSKYAKEVINKRQNFLNELEKYINYSGMTISGQIESFKIKYIPNVDCENIDKKYKDRESYDIFQKTTSVGPHRDDFYIEKDEKNIAVYGSQGQIRTAALSLKIGLSKYYKDKDIEIIVILDDVFSELDKTRQNKLINLVEDASQVFITTTSINELDQEIIEKSNIIKMERESEINER